MRLTPLQAGLTLIELMVTVSVAAILITVGVPSFTQFVQSARLDAAEDSFVGAVQFAQSEAVKRNATVSLVPNNADDNWSLGFQVKLGSEVLRDLTAVNGTLVCADACASLSFTGAGTATARTFSLCTQDNQGRQLVLYASGKIKPSDWNNCQGEG